MVQQIEINGKSVRVLFGMHFIEKFSSRIIEYADKGIEFSDTDALPLIVWFGYDNWCYSNKVPVELTEVEVNVGIEMFYHNDDDNAIAKLIEIAKEYNNSKMGKALNKEAAEVKNEAKKKLIGQKLKPSRSGR